MVQKDNVLVFSRVQQIVRIILCDLVLSGVQQIIRITLCVEA